MTFSKFWVKDHSIEDLSSMLNNYEQKCTLPMILHLIELSYLESTSTFPFENLKALIKVPLCTHILWKRSNTITTFKCFTLNAWQILLKWNFTPGNSFVSSNGCVYQYYPNPRACMKLQACVKLSLYDRLTYMKIPKLHSAILTFKFKIKLFNMIWRQYFFLLL